MNCLPPQLSPCSESIDGLLVFPASVLETIYALSVSCVSVSSRYQSQPGVSAPPALPWLSSVPSAPSWWSAVWLCWSSAPPWWTTVLSAPSWWALVPSAPPWWVSALSAPSCSMAPLVVLAPSALPCLPVLLVLPWCSAGSLSVLGLSTSSWTCPSVPPPCSASAPLPSWIVLSLERLKAAPWWVVLCHESGSWSSIHSPPEVTFSPHGLLHYHQPLH